MEPTKTTELGETVYKEFAGAGYEPGFKMNFTIVDLPQPGLFKRMNESIPGGNAVVFGFPVVIAIVMAGLVIYVLMSNRRRNLMLAVSPSERMKILQQIVELDEQLEKGEIDADEHQASRDAMTARALAGMETGTPPAEDREAPSADDQDEPAEKDDSSPA
jgi:uncharacterized membrane protein